MKKNKAVSATVYQTTALTTYTKAHKDLAKSHYSTSFRACQETCSKLSGFRKELEMKTESEMKINQYQNYKDFAEDTEIRELLSLLFSLPSNAFLHALKQMGKIAEQQQKTESQR